MIRLRTILLYDKLYIILVLIGLIYSYSMINLISPHSIYNINQPKVEGYIDKLKIDGDKMTIYLKSKEDIIVNYYFKTLKEKNNCNLKLGSYIKANGEMKNIKENGVFNLFSYKKYLNRNNIFYTFTATKIKLIPTKISINYKIKQLIIDHIDSMAKSSSYVKALVVGNDDEFSGEINNSYQVNGVSHLFAISGSHITFLSIIILFILKKLKVEENKRYYIVILFLLFYSFLTDYAGSVLRSVAFFIILVLNKIYYFNIKTINILYLTLFFLLLIKPNLLYDVGFQFSFLISLFLISYQTNIASNKNYFKQTFVISFISFLVSIPICINNFFQINLLSPIINIIFVPYVSFILFPLSFIALIIPPITYILFFFVNTLEQLSLFLSRIEISQIVISKPTFLIIIIYYIIISLAINHMFKKRYFWLIILCLFIIIHSLMPYFNNETSVVFLDVGQGDSIFISLAHNQGNILIDTGGKLEFKEDWQKKIKEYSIGENTIIPYLKSIGVNKLDYLFLTHGDEDHMKESLNLVKYFNVSKVVMNGGTINKLEASLISLLKVKSIPYVFGEEGDNIIIGGQTFYILNPSKKIDRDENSNSLVIYTKIYDTSFLFMGDAPIDIEKKIMQAYPNLSVDVLKLGHHGSITSSSETFLNIINPTYSIIEVGLNNMFKHPSPVVIRRLNNLDTKIYQTSLNGSIEIKLNKNRYKIKTCSP